MKNIDLTMCFGFLKNKMHGNKNDVFSFLVGFNLDSVFYHKKKIRLNVCLVSFRKMQGWKLKV
jgi:hypothetical protein